MTQVNSSFSQIQPNLQIAWDSTSLGELKTCARKYQLSIVEGWQPKRTSVHLIFGLHYHAALEFYDHQRANGMDHASATREALRKLLTLTWDFDLNRPWTSDDKNKNRVTLVRSVLWYLEHFINDPIETIILANGKPAVELSFRMETSYVAITGETYMLCGHLDRLGRFNGNVYVVDRKTSKSDIGTDFFNKFSPDNQMSTYALGSSVVYSLPVQGIIIDAVQVGVTFSRFGRGFAPRTKNQIEEWYDELPFWFAQAENYAKKNYWPMNDKACPMYGGCQYRGVCAKDPRTREMWLKADFTKRIWDPLQVRGDI